MSTLINYILNSKESKPSAIKSFLKDPDSHKVLLEVVNGEVVIRIRRKNGND